MGNMELNNYDLENLLLYLENKLSDKDSQVISNELLNDEDKLNHLIELAKIKSYTEANINKILFLNMADKWTSFCTGVVDLLEEKELSFRGQEQSYCYKYSFFDLIITIVQNQDNLWNIYINNPNSKNSYTIINNQGELMSGKENDDVQHVQVTTSGNYYILLKDQSETKILEINI